MQRGPWACGRTCSPARRALSKSRSWRGLDGGMIAPRSEMLADGGDERAHLRRRRDDVRWCSMLLEHERAGRSDRADDGAMPERVCERCAPPHARADLEQVADLHLIGERDRVQPA